MNKLTITATSILILIVVSLSISFAGQETMSPQFSIGYAKHNDRLPITGTVLLIWTAGGTESQSVSFKVPDVLAREDLTVRIFDVKGKCICDNGALSWDGRDHKGRRVCAGYYFFNLGTSDSSNPLQFDSDNSSDVYFWDVTATHVPADSFSSSDAECGDIDNDGDLDIVIGSHFASEISKSRVLINNGDGVFSDERELRLPYVFTYTNDIDLTDIDNDGDFDMYLALTGSDFTEYIDKIFVNNGNGYFFDESSLRLPEIMIPTQNAHFADIDNDGDQDLIVVYIPFDPLHSDVRIIINDGEGYFTESESERISLPKINAFDVITSDVDDDGDLDLIISALGMTILTNEVDEPIDTLLGQNTLLINNGSGWFEDQTEMRMPHMVDDCTREIDISDVNGDQAIDLYVVNIGFCRDEGINKILVNNGGGYFTDESEMRLPEEIYTWNNDADFGDVDLDGDLDIFLANVLPGEYAFDALLLNDGTGKFEDASLLLPGKYDFSTSCVLGDMDNDDDQDIITVNGSPTVGYFEGQDRFYLNMLYSEVEMLRGDVNNDGQIDVSDVLLCVNIMLHLYEPHYPEFLCADFNGDGSINVLDVVIIINEIITVP